MNYFERNRRNLFKNHHINGMEKSVSGVDSVGIKSSAGAPPKSLEIKGLSSLKNETELFFKYADYFKNLDNYVTIGSGFYFIPFPSEWLGKELTFSLVEKQKMENIAVEVADRVDPYPYYERLLGWSGEITTVTSNTYSHFMFRNIRDENLSEISEFWQSYALSVKYKSEKSNPTPDEPWTIGTLGEGLEIKLGERVVNVPKSVTVNGKSVPLLFSQWDKLTVDGKNKRVIYTEGSWQRKMTGTERLLLKTNTKPEYGNWYHFGTQIYDNAIPATGYGYCSHFKRGTYVDSSSNHSFIASQADIVVFFRKDDITTLDDFKAWLQQKYAEGNPVVLLVKRTTANIIEHDITGTELGRELLSLCAPAGTDATLEIKGGLDGAPINLVYYSTEEADTVNITIRYKDEEGNEIREPRVNETRKGSKYIIVAPHIDGYKRVSSEVYGVADSDTEIILEYRR